MGETCPPPERQTIQQPELASTYGAGHTWPPAPLQDNCHGSHRRHSLTLPRRPLPAVYFCHKAVNLLAGTAALPLLHAPLHILHAWQNAQARRGQGAGGQGRQEDNTALQGPGHLVTTVPVSTLPPPKVVYRTRLLATACWSGHSRRCRDVCGTAMGPLYMSHTRSWLPPDHKQPVLISAQLCTWGHIALGRAPAQAAQARVTTVRLRAAAGI